MDPNVLIRSWSMVPVGLGTETYGYDADGRLAQMGGSVSATATYGPAGEMLSLTTSFNGLSQSWNYNSMLQMVHESAPGLDMTYNYSATQNNGRIVSSVDASTDSGMPTAETTAYTYDSLNRLTGASNANWAQTFTYDGFGNMLTKSGTGGAPSLTQSFDANNRLIGPGYDANGNTWSAQSGYSVENRMIGSGYWSQYGYDPAGKRVMWQEQAYGTPNNNIQFYFYSITGQRIATVGCVAANDGHPGWWTYPNCNLVGQNVYFGGKLLVSNGVAVATDRLGSVRANAQGEKFRYYPYGEERTSTVNGRDKFGTYFRDLTGMDYADQRYYAPGTGRFGSADPMGGVWQLGKFEQI